MSGGNPPPDKTKKTHLNKHCFTYLLVMLALLCSNCANHEVLKPEVSEATIREVPIRFNSCYVDNAAKRRANALCKHLSTMGVWGWRNGMYDDNTLSFNDQAVAYNADSTRWEYAPLQYWREGCRYTFCAYAPHQQQTDATVSVDPLTHMISIKHITLHGHNLQETPTDTVKELFRDTPDTDWMISRAGQTAEGTAGMDVQFTMQHILAKLNIRIKACETMLARPYIVSVTADSIIVGALPSQGDFAQQLTHTPVICKPEEAAIEEWTSSLPNLLIKGSHPVNVAAEPIYIVESLVIPQHLEPQSNVTLYYTYNFTDGHSEQCRYCMPLTDAFSRFVSGYNHTLTFTICSDRITFEAGAIDWKEE